jgi:hypothetical protein
LWNLSEALKLRVTEMHEPQISQAPQVSAAVHVSVKGNTASQEQIVT